MFAPLTWALFFAVVGLVRARRRGSRRRVRGMLALGVSLAILVVFSLAPVANGLVRSLEASAVDTTRPDVTYDAVIVLGGMVSEQLTESTGKPQYNESIERLLAAFEMLRDGRARNALLTAGSPGRPVKDSVEARVLARQLEAWGISKERLFVEDQSRNTRENALYSEPIIRAQGWRTLALVTTAFHMKRAAGCFRAVGLTFDMLPVDYRAYDPARARGGLLPQADQLAISTGAIHEHIGRIAYRVRGYTRE